MKTRIFILSILMTAGLISAAFCTEPARKPATETIKWYSYDEGMALGKTGEKKVFLNFYADWCGFCKMMDSRTFVDKGVVDYLNENFIPIKVDSDKKKNVAREYNVRALPVSWFIESNGKPIASREGFIEPSQMLNMLKFIRTDSYKKMQYSEFIKKM